MMMTDAGIFAYLTGLFIGIALMLSLVYIAESLSTADIIWEFQCDQYSVYCTGQKFLNLTGFYCEDKLVCENTYKVMR